MATKQTNIVANTDRNLIFFEGEELCYNFKTNQWSRIPAYNDYGMYSISNKSSVIGLVVYSSGSVDLQEQANTDPAQAAVVGTGAIDLNQAGRSIVTGIRPLVAGGTVTVSAGTMDAVGDTITWSTAVSVNSRSLMANFREEGRYVAARVSITGGFEAALGADVEFSPTGFA